MNRRPVAAVAVLAVALAACGGGSKSTTDTTAPATSVATTTPALPIGSGGSGGATTAPEATTTTAAPAPTSVTIRPMYYNSSTKKGGLGTFTLSVGTSGDKALRVAFSEDEVAGLGDQYRAAVWNAVTVALLLTGKPLSGEYRADVKGYIDGPSAGALTTVGVLALLQGDTLKPEVTMTGTINPDGTVGPVGGIAEKLVGAKELGIKTVLVPVGQRNVRSASDGSLVDVVDLGKRNGVEVREVGDVYEAYEAFTGESLPRLPSVSSVKLDETTYQRLKAKADEGLALYQQATGKLGAVDPAVLAELVELTDEAERLAGRAADLERQGLQAGAFSYAWQAAAYAGATLSLGENLQVLVTQGVGPYVQRVLAGQAITAKTSALLATLKTFTPKTLSDASVLMATYGTALDAYTVASTGQAQLQAIDQAVANGSMTLQEALAQVIVPTVYFELAGTVVDYAKAIFEVGRDLEGPPVSSGVKLSVVADFFRKASDANFQSFRTTVVNEMAAQAGVNEASALSRFANFDADVALSMAARNTIDTLKQYIGEGEANAEYAQLGFAITNYARNAGLVAKYYSNGELDADGQVVGVRSDAALTGGLDLGRTQLAASIGILRSAKASPALQVAIYEAAAVQREGDVSDKFSALTSYWEGLVSARVLAYLGGFETQGLK